VPLRDWAGQPNGLDEIELIAVAPDAARVVAREEIWDPEGLLLTHRVKVPETGLVLRARGRRHVAGGPDLLFHTNPVRVVAAP
jgi:hypothetical protein